MLVNCQIICVAFCVHTQVCLSARASVYPRFHWICYNSHYSNHALLIKHKYCFLPSSRLLFAFISRCHDATRSGGGWVGSPGGGVGRWVRVWQPCRSFNQRRREKTREGTDWEWWQKQAEVMNVNFWGEKRKVWCAPSSVSKDGWNGGGSSGGWMMRGVGGLSMYFWDVWGAKSGSDLKTSVVFLFLI